MAQRVHTLYIDDIDGSEAVGTVKFGLDGQGYEIDLNAANQDNLRQVFAPYVSHARRVHGPSGRSKPGKSRQPQPHVEDDSQATNAEIREWAKGRGISLKDRGRISRTVKAAFEANDPSLIAAELRQNQAPEPEPMPEPIEGFSAWTFPQVRSRMRQVDSPELAQALIDYEAAHGNRQDILLMLTNRKEKLQKEAVTV